MLPDSREKALREWKRDEPLGVATAYQEEDAVVTQFPSLVDGDLRVLTRDR